MAVVPKAHIISVEPALPAVPRIQNTNERRVDMGKLEEDVRELILDQYSSLAAFARDIDIPEHTLYSALSKGLRKTTLSTIAPICVALDIDPLEVANGRLTFNSGRRKPVFVPIYGLIVAGAPVEMEETAGEFPIPAELHDAYPNAFILRVEGNSMNRVLEDGFLVLVDPCRTVGASGKIYVVVIGEQKATVKRVILHDNGITLQPESYDPTYKPMLFDYADTNAPTVSVIGRVVWWCPPAA